MDLRREIWDVVKLQLEDDLGHSVRHLSRKTGASTGRVRRVVKKMAKDGLVRLVEYPSIPVMVKVRQ